MAERKINIWQILTIILSVIVSFQSFLVFGSKSISISNKEIGEKVISYINKNLVAPGTNAIL
ncbi:MAG: hypothetical protein QXJ14_03680, partial [Candidatus Aenigmatarchaeota archaeon]